MSIRFLSITVCILGRRFGHGWVVEITSAREGKSAYSRWSKKSRVLPANRCFLHIDYEDSSYIGCLLRSDHGFCSQIVRIMEANLNKTIAAIGSLDISRLYKPGFTLRPLSRCKIPRLFEFPILFRQTLDLILHSPHRVFHETSAPVHPRLRTYLRRLFFVYSKY